MKYAYILILLLFHTFSCGSPEAQVEKHIAQTRRELDTLTLLTDNNWNLTLNELDTTLHDFENHTLTFGQKHAFFNGSRVGAYLLKKDTLILRDSSYQVSLSGIAEKPTTYTYLFSVIRKISTDSLVIEKFSGKYNKAFFGKGILRFYNDSLGYNPKYHLNKVVYSNSTCYGDCPAMAIRIEDNGSYQFYGGYNSDLQGYHVGRISKQFVKELEEILRLSNFTQYSDTFPSPVDAPVNEMFIYYNDTLLKRFYGNISSLPPRVSDFAFQIYKSPDIATLDSVAYTIDFETKTHKPAPPPLPINNEQRENAH